MNHMGGAFANLSLLGRGPFFPHSTAHNFSKLVGMADCTTRTDWSVKHLKRRLFASNTSSSKSCNNTGASSPDDYCHPMKKEATCCTALADNTLPMSTSSIFSIIDDDTDATTVRASFCSTISSLTEKQRTDCFNSSIRSNNHHHDNYCHHHHATASSRRRRRVHFATDDDGCLLTQVHLFVVSAREEKQQQKSPFAGGANSEPVCHFAKYQEDSLNAITEDSCRTLLGSIDQLYFGKGFNKTDGEAEEKRMEAMARLAKMEGGQYRGLEATLMKRSHKRRNGHLKDILERQRQLRQQQHHRSSSSPPKTTTSLEAQLRRTSRKYSKASTEFALFLAVGDNMVLVQHDDDVEDTDEPQQDELAITEEPLLLIAEDQAFLITETRAEL
jgi:hypothetical protein